MTAFAFKISIYVGNFCLSRQHGAALVPGQIQLPHQRQCLALQLWCDSGVSVVVLISYVPRRPDLKQESRSPAPSWASFHKVIA